METHEFRTHEVEIFLCHIILPFLANVTRHSERGGASDRVHALGTPVMGAN